MDLKSRSRVRRLADGQAAAWSRHTIDIARIKGATRGSLKNPAAGSASRNTAIATAAPTDNCQKLTKRTSSSVTVRFWISPYARLMVKKVLNRMTTAAIANRPYCSEIGRAHV